MAINTLKYLESVVHIKTKDNKIVNFIPNEPQLKLYNIIKKCHEEKRPVRVIILKARQMGFSTMTGGIVFKNVATKPNTTGAIVAHTEMSTTNLFNMYKLMYDYLPQSIRPQLKASNAKELIFNDEKGQGLNSKIRCMTAGSKGIGRSFTITYLHLSELAFWEGNVNETLTGLVQAVPTLPQTMIIIESTANGYETFKDLWDQAVNGESDYVPLFVGWNEMKEYRQVLGENELLQLTEEERDLKDKYSLDDEQLKWRRDAIRNLCHNDINQFHQEYPICPEEAFLATGNCIFNTTKINNRLKELKDPQSVGHFVYEYDLLNITNITYSVDEQKGPVTIWEPPEEGRFYTIGGDTAGEGSDYFYCHVIDNTSGQQVARYRAQTDETLFARQVYCLGKYYNNSLIILETNFSTYPIKELERLGYDNMYVREREDKYTGGTVESYGFKTTSLTRPIIINLVVDMIRDNIQLINDRILLNECLTFVKNAVGRPQALEGKHDDGVISYGITLYGRSQQEMNVVSNSRPVVKKFIWPQDLIDDYWSGNDDTRKIMEDKYGEVN